MRRTSARLAAAGAAGSAPARLLPGSLAFAVMAVVAAVDLLAGSGVGFLPLLSLGPVLAAVSMPPARTAATGGLAMAACAALAFYDGQLGTHRGHIAFATIAGVTVAAVLASHARYIRERELADITAIAEAAQRILLRPVPSRLGPLSLAVRYISASSAARIGGDLYEAVVTGGRLRLIVGDVQGKGLTAARTAATVLGAFREAAYDAPDLPALATRIELSLERQAAEEEFVTCMLAEVGAAPGIRLMNCGHPPPLLMKGSGERFVLPPRPDLPLGLTDLAPAERVADDVAFGPGDRILFYTDGVSEARDERGEFFRLEGFGERLAGLDPQAALDQLAADVTTHVGHSLHDDAAMLIISYGQEADQAG